MFLQYIWYISWQRGKILWLFLCITLIVVDIKSLLAETKVLSGVAWWGDDAFQLCLAVVQENQLWEKSPIKQIKWLGIDKYHGSYVELRSASKWENMKAHLLRCMNIVTKRVRLCLSRLLHISLWHKTSGQHSSVWCADYSTGKLLCSLSNTPVKCGTNLMGWVFFW